jgi:hypothetical protein
LIARGRTLRLQLAALRCAIAALAITAPLSLASAQSSEQARLYAHARDIAERIQTASMTAGGATWLRVMCRDLSDTTDRLRQIATERRESFTAPLRWESALRRVRDFPEAGDEQQYGAALCTNRSH